MQKDPVVVIGAGAWGTATANVFADAGHPVTLWCRDAELAKSLNEKRENPKYLPGVRLSESLTASTDLNGVLAKSSWVVNAIPTQQIRNVFGPVAGLLAGKNLVNTSKGIEIRSHKRVSEIVTEIAPNARYLILSGPSFALETVKRLPTAVTVACRDEKLAGELQKMVSTPYFRAYSSQDVVGVELAGALKNVIAVASGMVSGLQLGYNAQAAIINRGIAEMARAGKQLGADPRTFLGLAGMGDLVLTCTGPLSRNRKLGVLLAEGKRTEDAQKLLGGVAEGFYTAHSAHELATSAGIDMPIMDQVYRILYEGSTPQRAVAELMSRDLKHEWA
jgi:glycerol-3-phosphate dehydrogenase (NAD(P)+)